MDILNFLKDYWAVLIGMVTLIVTFVKLFTRVNNMEKMIIPVDTVRATLEAEVEKQLKNHCPFHNDITELKAKINSYDSWIKTHEKFAAEANEQNHLLLQELVINTQNICENIGIKYLKKNGQ